MPWKPKDTLHAKRQFLELALQEGCNWRELCRRFGITPKTGYAILSCHSADPEVRLKSTVNDRMGAL